MYNYFGDYMNNFKNSLFNSILFLILGIILFTNPGGIVKFISYIVGIVLICIGGFNSFSYYKTKKNLNIVNNSQLASGIILVVLGLISILFAGFIESTIRLICGGWIIYSGVLRLIESISFKSDRITYIIEMAIAVLMIICGFYVALKTNLVFSAIGLVIIIYSIMDIIGYIVYKVR